MSPVISSDVSEDMAEEIEDIREEGESRSAAVKRLLRKGMKAEKSGDGVYVTYPSIIFVIGLYGFTAAFADAVPLVGYLGFALIVIAFTTSLAKRIGWL